jgi:hypothetical protein
LAESAQSAAIWAPGEAGVSVSLVSGEGLVAAAYLVKPGRGLSFVMDRSYRSGALDYGPLGSAGWSSSLFAHLREIPTTGEVEYHYGRGHVWRFYPADSEGVEPSEAPASDPEGLFYATRGAYDPQAAGQYYAPKGVYLSLQRIATGWRLVGRNNDSAFFDTRGRLVELSDRHRQGAVDTQEQGNPPGREGGGRGGGGGSAWEGVGARS